jgi:hypothetical protein
MLSVWDVIQCGVKEEGAGRVRKEMKERFI